MKDIDFYNVEKIYNELMHRLQNYNIVGVAKTENSLGEIFIFYAQRNEYSKIKTYVIGYVPPFSSFLRARPEPILQVETIDFDSSNALLDFFYKNNFNDIFSSTIYAFNETERISMINETRIFFNEIYDILHKRHTYSKLTMKGSKKLWMY